VGEWVSGWVYIVHIHIEYFLSRVVAWIMEGKLKVRKPLRNRIYLFKEGCFVFHGNRHSASHSGASNLIECDVMQDS
jgi:hypothetical protein